MNFNWIDLIILAVVAYYVLIGWESGLVRLAGNLVSFLVSLWLAIKFNIQAGNFLTNKFGFPPLWANVIGYIGIATLAETLLAEVLRFLTGKLPSRLATLKINKLLGAVLSVANCLVIMAFILMIVMILPLRGSAKQDVERSVIGSKLIFWAGKYGGEVATSVDRAAKEAVKFLTVKPSSDESIKLNLESVNLKLTVDEAAEARMLELVNAERVKAGVGTLKLDAKMILAARAHSKDMFERSYFSHYDPQGRDAGYRLEKAGVKFSFAGENLAYAPDTNTAHTGLMNSEGHRKNILEPEFTRIGIGVYDAGIYGKMFTQEFAD